MSELSTPITPVHGLPGEPGEGPWILVSVFVTLAICPVCMVLSPIQGYSNGDSLVPVLVSTQHWTPFYWGANRYGMFLPLVALPFRDPLTNLEVQSLLSFGLSIGAFFAAARLIFGRPYWIAAGAVTAAIQVACYPDGKLFDYLGLAQPYAHALGLCYAGLVLLVLNDGVTHVRKYCYAFSGSVLVLSSLWVTPTLVLTVFPVLFFCILLSDESRNRISDSSGGVVRRGIEYLSATRNSAARNRFLLSASVLSVSFVLIYACMNLSRVKLSYQFLSPTEWPEAWKMLAARFLEWISPNGVFSILLPLLACSGLGLALAGNGSRSSRRAFLAFEALAVAVTCEFLVVGSSDWVQQNNYRPTYLTPSAVLIFVVVVGANVTLILDKLPRIPARVAGVSALVVLVLCVLVKFGPPAPQKMRFALERKIGHYTEDLLRSGSTLFAGNYWKVWPTVFHANMLLHERGIRKTVYGIAHRSQDVEKLWALSAGKRAYVAGALDDPEVGQTLIRYGGHVKKVKEVGTIGLYALPAGPWIVDLPHTLFSSRLGTINKGEGALVSCSRKDGKEGFALYGPYLSLPPGRYSASMSGTVTNVDPHKEVLGFFDVARDFGRQVTYKRQIRDEDVKNGTFTISCEFSVLQFTEGWEFRFYYWPESDLTVERVTLSKIGCPSADNPGDGSLTKGRPATENSRQGRRN